MHRSIAMDATAACLVISLSIAASTAMAGSVPAPPAQTSTAQTSTLIVKVTGLRNAKGKVAALLFRSADGFPDKDARASDSEEVPIDPKTLTAQIVFQHIPQGPAAVTVLHDENMNQKLDTNFFGIPREGYGASNNPPKRHRAPTFAEATFSVSSPTETIHINLIYW